MGDAVTGIRVRATRGAMAVVLAVAGASLVGQQAARAAAPVILGYASNFDVSDTTDKPCHGFEIEIEDITDTNIVYTWGNYRYGHPSSIANVAAFPSGHSGVRVKYQATYSGSAWTQTTAIGGTEHFGVSINATAGIQRYSWLCEDSLSPGTLIEYGGSTSGNHYPTAVPPAPRAVVVPTPTGEVVRQEIQNAEPPEPGQLASDAMWVRRYASSSPGNVTLDQLTAADPAVNDTVANSMLDGQFELLDGGATLTDDDPVSASDEASVLVVDTYAYTGPYDDSHTPSCDGLGGANDCSNFIGATRLSRQMFSADLATASAARVALNVKVMTGLSNSTTGGSVTSGVIPSADPGVGIDCGTSCFTVVDSGSSVTLTAHPSTGYHVQSWGGACSGTALTCVVNVNATTPVVTTFYPNAPAVLIGDTSVVEGKTGTSKVAKFAVALTSAQATTTVVSYATSNGTATAGSDYTAKTGSVSIAAGKTSATVSVTVAGDAAVEGDETFSVDVLGVSPVAVAIGNPSATGTIADDDTALAPVLSLGAASVFEGNAGTQTAYFTLTLSSPSLTPTPVTYHTADGTATAGSDYTAKTGTVTIAAGATSAKIAVVVKGDTTAEGDDTFHVVVDGTGASGISTDHDTVLGTILDDDTLGFSTVGIGDAQAVEGHTGTKTVSLVVTLSAPAVTSTLVKYHTIDGSAVAGSDFTAKTGTLTILAGKRTGTIAITVNGDTGIESNETFSVRLDSAGALPIHHGTATATVVTDDF